MRAIILAAGAGTRMRQLTQKRPKCLVAVGERPLLDIQLDALRGAGVEDIVVVVGFEAKQVRDHCGPGVRYVVNEQWQTTNSIFSLYQAARWLEGERVFLFNCDILFDRRLLVRLLEHRGSSIAVDSRAARLEGEMNVRVDDDGVVRAIGKHLDPATTTAVSVQLAAFDASGAQQVRTELERLVYDDERDAFPTSAYGPLVAAGGMAAIEAGDLPWAEIDTVEDYERAVAQVAPRLLG
ncbi:MAG TPA: phosphocholine cytidylyltransferase family protein [Candidatus Latescibacteria bacterium]|nr:phosphocholine cytidylyltransferase family protein [Candidatus Latescibacterota bacterium]